MARDKDDQECKWGYSECGIRDRYGVPPNDMECLTCAVFKTKDVIIGVIDTIERGGKIR